MGEGEAFMCSSICLAELNIERLASFGDVAKWSILTFIIISIMNTLMEFHTF